MKLLLSLLLSSIAFAQSPPPPDCTLGINLGGTGTTGTFDNRTIGCQTWTLVYQASSAGGSISAISVTFQSANGATAPGPFSTYGGTTETGANPATNTTGENSTFSNGTVIASWVRVSVTVTATGTPSVVGTLYGYKSGYAGSGGGGGGGGCTAPCVVIGPTAAGSPPADAPVLTGSEDTNGNTRNVLSDVNGSLLSGAYPSTAAPFGVTTGIQQVIAAVAGKAITISHWDVLYVSAGTFQLVYGTGTNCGTGATSVTAQYPNSFLGGAWDVPVVIPAGNAVCYNIGTGATTWAGFLIYVQR